MDREQLIVEIEKLKPWYQRIEFSEYGVTTTDKEEWAFIDCAPDNLFPGMTHVDSSILRPVAKWNYIRSFLPNLKGRRVLEIGCNCGFFSYEFAKLGADVVYGIDLNISKNALFARKVLNLEEKVKFLEGDFLYMKHRSSPCLSLGSNDNLGEIPDVDIVFASAVLTHMGYPFFALDKMLRTANEYLIIDEQFLNIGQNEVASLGSFDWPIGHVVHSFRFTISMYRNYLLRLGVPLENIQFNIYPEMESSQQTKVCIVVKTDFIRDSSIKPFHP